MATGTNLARSVDPSDMSLTDILPTHIRHYSYSGSLTTPPCTEGVQWVILEEPILISQQDVDQFVHLIWTPCPSHPTLGKPTG